VQGRAFDVDDVILNTSGALLGYLLLGRRFAHATAARPEKAVRRGRPRVRRRR
jgi:glycopeptide antibiotics resistance protein